MADTILVDTREKRPLRFPGEKTRRATLATGDYSLHGYSKVITVEYKSLPDYLKWISVGDKKRRVSQLERLIPMEYSCIVVGASLGSRSKYSFLTKDEIIERTAKLTAIGVPIIFSRDRRNAAAFILHFLRTAKVRYVKTFSLRDTNLSGLPEEEASEV